MKKIVLLFRKLIRFKIVLKLIYRSITKEIQRVLNGLLKNTREINKLNSFSKINCQMQTPISPYVFPFKKAPCININLAANSTHRLQSRMCWHFGAIKAFANHQSQVKFCG